MVRRTIKKQSFKLSHHDKRIIHFIGHRLYLSPLRVIKTRKILIPEKSLL